MPNLQLNPTLSKRLELVSIILILTKTCLFFLSNLCINSSILNTSLFLPLITTLLSTLLTLAPLTPSKEETNSFVSILNIFTVLTYISSIFLFSSFFITTFLLTTLLLFVLSTGIYFNLEISLSATYLLLENDKNVIKYMIYSFFKINPPLSNPN